MDYMCVSSRVNVLMAARGIQSDCHSANIRYQLIMEFLSRTGRSSEDISEKRVIEGYKVLSRVEEEFMVVRKQVWV